MRNSLDSDNVVHSHWWISWNPSSTTPSTFTNMYEDATYTTVPGDKGTDTTNQIQLIFHSTSLTWGQLDWKFWTSDVDDSTWMVIGAVGAQHAKEHNEIVTNAALDLHERGKYFILFIDT